VTAVAYTRGTNFSCIHLLNKIDAALHPGEEHLEYSSGILNSVADQIQDCMLAPQVFKKINQTMNTLDVNLFTSQLTYQLPYFIFSQLEARPQAAAVDAFQ